MKLVYLGNMMANGHKVKPDEKYNRVDSLVFKQAANTKYKHYIDVDKKDGTVYPTRSFEVEQVDGLIESYDSDTFWEELIERLAKRDVIEEFSLSGLEAMSEEERDEQGCKHKKLYGDEFAEYGVARLRVVPTDSVFKKVEEDPD